MDPVSSLMRGDIAGVHSTALNNAPALHARARHVRASISKNMDEARFDGAPRARGAV